MSKDLKLQNWCLTTIAKTILDPPDSGPIVLYGIYDGQWIFTSEVKWLNPFDNIARTISGSTYHLDKPDKQWLEMIENCGLDLITLSMKLFGSIPDVTDSKCAS